MEKSPAQCHTVVGGRHVPLSANDDHAKPFEQTGVKLRSALYKSWKRVRRKSGRRPLALES